jgi:hypothetical protein
MAMSAVLEEVAVQAASCANCEQPVEGKFCGACGQRAHIHKSLLHLGEEIIHGLLHFDAKGIRTLPMLVAYPGQLTRRYIDGQRTRFVSPLGLFLFMVFFLFFVGSLTSGSKDKLAGDSKAKVEKRLEQAREKMADAEAELARERAAGKDVTESQEDLDNAKAALAQVDAAGKKVGANVENFYDGDDLTGNKWFDDALRHAGENKELTAYKLKNSGAKFSFLLVPISLPFIWLLFCLRRDLTMYDHAVFALYSLCFMSLLCALLFILNYIGLKSIMGILLLVAPPLHMYRQLRGAYGIGRWAAIWRTMTLMFVASIVMILYMLIILGLSMG